MIKQSSDRRNESDELSPKSSSLVIQWMCEEGTALQKAIQFRITIILCQRVCVFGRTHGGEEKLTQHVTKNFQVL